jgi:hypothetical protein
MLKFYAIMYQHSPLCDDKKFVAAIKVGAGENGEEKALAVLNRERGKVFYRKPVQITRERAKQLAPSIFKTKV